MGGPPLQRWEDTNGLPIRVPTAKAMGHPTPQLMADGALARRRPRLPQTVQRGSAFPPISPALRCLVWVALLGDQSPNPPGVYRFEASPTGNGGPLGMATLMRRYPRNLQQLQDLH